MSESYKMKCILYYCNSPAKVFYYFKGHRGNLVLRARCNACFARREAAKTIHAPEIHFLSEEQYLSYLVFM